LRWRDLLGMMPVVELAEKDISLKFLSRVLPLLGKLHRSGTERDSAGNRTLFFDDYTKLVLTYLFNPLIDSPPLCI
jgi:hypothetical protein